MRRGLFQKTVTCSVFLLLLGFHPALLSAEEPSEEERNSQIVGKVIQSDGTPAIGAMVLAYHLSSEQLFESAPADGRGNFVITRVPHGYFDLAVQMSDGRFDGTQVVNVPPAGKAILVFQLAPFHSDELPREFPGGQGPGDGTAQLGQKQSKGQFWRSPKGVAVIAGGGGVLLLGLASGGSSSSPSN